MRLFSGISQIGIMVYQWNKKVKRDPPLRQNEEGPFSLRPFTGPVELAVEPGGPAPTGPRTGHNLVSFSLRPVLARPEVRSGPAWLGHPPGQSGLWTGRSERHVLLDKSFPRSQLRSGPDDPVSGPVRLAPALGGPVPGLVDRAPRINC
jgi:hypothetical protein